MIQSTFDSAARPAAAAGVGGGGVNAERGETAEDRMGYDGSGWKLKRRRKSWDEKGRERRGRPKR